MKKRTPSAIVTLISLVMMTLIVASCSGGAEQPQYEKYPLVPLPAVFDPGEGDFLLRHDATAAFDPAFLSAETTLELFNEFLGKHYRRFHVATGSGSDREADIVATLDESLGNREAYDLSVTGDRIEIRAGGEAGLFYAFQTLMQLIYPNAVVTKGAIPVPCLTISDAPQYRWRGMHLDVCRHFFPKEFIFRMLDVMAMHKLNTFHWHLTDDQGWRIEIEKYPELATVAAWRDETLIGHGSETPWVYDGIRHGGYYTKEDIREVISYAARLHINVLPEIEMPGHAVAALQAYPELSCGGEPVPPFNRWGVSEDVFCAGKEATFDFLQGVLSEVAELFPYEYIHIGGDECPKVRWQECPDCQQRIADNNLKDEHELQSYFVKRIEAFLAGKGKKIIGWDEILEGGIADNAAVMSWRGHSGGIQAANMGHDVVMTPHTFVYLDYYQSKYNEPLSIGGMLDLRKVYSIDIMPPEISEDRRKHIAGAQANLWTEYIGSQEHVEYMALPRLAALAEALWTPGWRQDFDAFSLRMTAQYARYDDMGLNYRVPYPGGYEAINLVTEEAVTVELDNGIPGSAIYYTTDGREPGPRSARYSGPLTIDPDDELVLKSVTVMPSGRRSAVMTGTFRRTKLREPVSPEGAEQGIRFTMYRGAYDSVNDITGQPDSAGVTAQIRIPAGAPAENFGLLFEGLLMVPEDGVYTFLTSSDDGVQLFIGDELVVDGDRLHHGITNEGRAALKAGMHPVTVRYFQRLYRQSLGVSWRGPATPGQTIPASALFHTP